MCPGRVRGGEHLQTAVFVWGAVLADCDDSGSRGDGCDRRLVGCTVLGLGFRLQASGFRVQASGFRVQGSGFRIQGSGFRGWVKATTKERGAARSSNSDAPYGSCSGVEHLRVWFHLVSRDSSVKWQPPVPWYGVYNSMTCCNRNRVFNSAIE